MGKGVSSMENMPVVNLGHARKAFGSNEVLKEAAELIEFCKQHVVIYHQRFCTEGVYDPG